MNKNLSIDNTDLDMISSLYGTPCFVYSKNQIISNYQQYKLGFSNKSHMICFSVKANSNLSILKILKDCGAGFDIVSGGELKRVLAIGADPAKIIFSGVGKTTTEIIDALQANIACFNVESIGELSRIEIIAKDLNKIAPVSIRVNPNIDAKTHPYISTGLKENKFGIMINDALSVYQSIVYSKYLKAVGIDCHIGSQLTDISPFVDAVNLILQLVEQLDTLGINLQYLDFGGGLGINYQNDKPPKHSVLSNTLAQLTKNRSELIIIEPGRSIVGNAGIFLTKVEYLKSNGKKNFCIVDGAMNDLIRPSLYNAWQEIKSVQNHLNIEKKFYDIVGPVCETGDFLGKKRQLAVKVGDILAVMNAGAYGFVMSSNYNTRGRAAEILIENGTHRLIRQRETIESLFADELTRLND